MKTKIGGLLLALCLAMGGLAIAPGDAHAIPASGGAIPTPGTDSKGDECLDAMERRTDYGEIQSDLLEKLAEEIRAGRGHSKEANNLRTRLELIGFFLERAINDVNKHCAGDLPERPGGPAPKTLPEWH